MHVISRPARFTATCWHFISASVVSGTADRAPIDCAGLLQHVDGRRQRQLVWAGRSNVTYPCIHCGRRLETYCCRQSLALVDP